MAWLHVTTLKRSPESREAHPEFCWSQGFALRLYLGAVLGPDCFFPVSHVQVRALCCSAFLEPHLCAPSGLQVTACHLLTRPPQLTTGVCKFRN